MTGTLSADNTSARRNHLFHHASNDMPQNVGLEQSRQQQMNEMLYGKERWDGFQSLWVRPAKRSDIFRDKILVQYFKPLCHSSDAGAFQLKTQLWLTQTQVLFSPVLSWFSILYKILIVRTSLTATSSKSFFTSYVRINLGCRRQHTPKLFPQAINFFLRFKLTFILLATRCKTESEKSWAGKK